MPPALQLLRDINSIFNIFYLSRVKSKLLKTESEFSNNSVTVYVHLKISSEADMNWSTLVDTVT